MLVVLHSWSQQLKLHVHTHVLLPAGGWSVDDPKRFVTTDREEWLLSEQLMPVFREKLIRELCKARRRGDFAWVGRAEPLADQGRWERWCDDLSALEWKGNVKPPVLPAEMTLEYLGRYASRIAIGNSRILEINVPDRSVTFSYRDNHGTDHEWGSHEETTIDALEFIDRFLLHVMPERMSRVRSYGWWSDRKKAEHLPRIRVALGMREVKEDARAAPESGDDRPADEESESDEQERKVYIRCHKCNQMTMAKVEHVPKPSWRRIMTWILWRELDPDARQMVFPEVEPYLRASDIHYEPMRFR